MKTKITYNVCRENLGDNTTDAQYAAYKSFVARAISNEFPDADVIVGDSGFANSSTCAINNHGETEISRDDVEQAVDSVGEEWWSAE